MFEFIIKGVTLRRNTGLSKRKSYIGARGIPRKLVGDYGRPVIAERTAPRLLVPFRHELDHVQYTIGDITFLMFFFAYAFNELPLIVPKYQPQLPKLDTA